MATPTNPVILESFALRPSTTALRASADVEIAPAKARSGHFHGVLGGPSGPCCTQDDKLRASADVEIAPAKARSGHFHGVLRGPSGPCCTQDDKLRASARMTTCIRSR